MPRVMLTVNGEETFYIEVDDCGQPQIRPTDAPLVSRDDQCRCSLNENGRTLTLTLRVEQVP